MLHDLVIVLSWKAGRKVIFGISSFPEHDTSKLGGAVPGVDERLGFESSQIIAGGTSGAGAKKTQVQFRTGTGTLVDDSYPGVVVESSSILVGDPVTCGASIGTIVVELNEEKIELSAGDCKAHVALWKRTLRSSRDQVRLRAWLGGLVSSKVFAKSLNASNVTSLVIWRRSLDIEIESINVDHFCQIGVAGATVQGTDTSLCNP